MNSGSWWAASSCTAPRFWRLWSSVLTTQVTAQMMEDWADIMDIEFVHITKDTTVEQMKEKLFFADLAWKLR